MPQAGVYELHIDAFRPETMPMARLAGYMASFAELLGHGDHVHFTGVKAGSVSLAARVDETEQPKVARRLEEVCYGGGAQEARKAFRKIDDLLAEDNAVGRITHGEARVIEFPGRTRHVETMLGPMEQESTLDGEVIQIGGRDETINVHIRGGDGIHHCVTSRGVARRLAAHIFGPVIRVKGRAVWARMESGAWVLKRFEISDFEQTDETPLAKLFEGLRGRSGPPDGGRMNPVDLMRQLREE